MATVTLINDFHRSSATIETGVTLEVDGVYVIKPTAAQLEQAKQSLCDSPECTCGRIRGLQTYEGRKLEIIEPHLHQ